MAFFGVRCPECRSKEKVHRKRRSGIRYAPFFDDTGIAVGEFRYYHLHCHHCEALFYLQERRFYEATDAFSQKVTVPEEAFQKASLHKPGMARIGTTASEYTVSIAAGADRPYALNRLRFNR
jgi:hypothetical protein